MPEQSLSAQKHIVTVQTSEEGEPLEDTSRELNQPTTSKSQIVV